MYGLPDLHKMHRRSQSHPEFLDEQVVSLGIHSVDFIFRNGNWENNVSS